MKEEDLKELNLNENWMNLEYDVNEKASKFENQESSIEGLINLK